MPRRWPSSRRTPRRGSRSGDVRKAPTFRPSRRTGDQGVLDSRRRRGASRSLTAPSVRGQAPSLRRIDPPSHTIAVSPVLGATDGGTGMSPRKRRLDERRSPLPHLSSVLRGPGDGGEGAGVARSLLSPKGEGCRTPNAPKGAGGKRRRTYRRGRETRPPVGASEDRTLGVVLARHAVVAEVVPRWPAQRNGRTSISPDLEAFVDGRLERSSSTRKCAGRRAKCHRHPHRSGSSRDRSREGDRGPRLDAGR